ncbi:MAG: ABC transporter permease [Burkholderiaceae bacterium]
MRLKSQGAVAAIAPGLGFLAALLLIVEAMSRAGMVNRVFVPAPSTVLQEVYGLIASGSFAEPLLQTLGTFFTGYFIGCGIALALGLLMGTSRAAYALLEPLTEFLRATPKPALLPPLMLLLGLGASMKLTIVALAALFPVLVSTVQGVRGVDRVLLDTGRTFGFSRGQTIRRIVLPAALPHILAGMRVSLGIALVVVVLSEMLAGTGGLGDQLVSMQRSFRLTQTFAWLVIVAVIGLCLTWVFAWVERSLLFWHAPIAR